MIVSGEAIHENVSYDCSLGRVGQRNAPYLRLAAGAVLSTPGQMVPDLSEPRLELPTSLFHHDDDLETGILEQADAADPKGHKVEVDRLLDNLR